MRISWKYFIILFCFIYVLITAMSMYKLYTENSATSDQKNQFSRRNYSYLSISELSLEKTVEIWGKASIGQYLWKHILNGELQSKDNGLTQEGYLTVNDITFIYRSGPGIIQTTVPQNVQHLVLVLNGRSEEKITAARLWLDYLPSYPRLRKLAVVLLGNEKCSNDWILPYVRSRGGKIDLVFLVYDSSLVDNVEFFQWPLGVAEYRGFPNVKQEEVDVSSSRTHICNFLGTVYENSSRETLMEVLRMSQYQNSCFILQRKQWLPKETQESLKLYIDTLLQSDVTLCPVGKNTECYRIYEALSLGSMPVVENLRTEGFCAAPLQLLKHYGAPVKYVTNWTQLHRVRQEGFSKRTASL